MCSCKELMKIVEKFFSCLSAGTIHTPAWQTYLSVWGRKRVRLDSDESDNGRGNTIISTELFLLGLFFLRANDTYFFYWTKSLGTDMRSGLHVSEDTRTGIQVKKECELPVWYVNSYPLSRCHLHVHRPSSMSSVPPSPAVCHSLLSKLIFVILCDKWIS